MHSAPENDARYRRSGKALECPRAGMLSPPDAGGRWNLCRRKKESPGAQIPRRVRASRESLRFRDIGDDRDGNCSLAYSLNGGDGFSAPGRVQPAFAFVVRFGGIEIVPFVGKIML